LNVHAPFELLDRPLDSVLGPDGIAKLSNSTTRRSVERGRPDRLCQPLD
jgi:hypothetical protein